MKSAQLIYEKKPLKCWIAESYEPYFFMKTPESCWYKIIEETDLVKEGIDQNGFQRKVSCVYVKNSNNIFKYI